MEHELRLIFTENLSENIELNENSNSKLKYHKYDYHIVYSPTYQVPVLYFNGYNLDGTPLKWSEIWDDLPVQIKNEEIRWTSITQKDHPLLFTPFYHVHPCNTAVLMTELFTKQLIESTKDIKKVNYLLAWLGIYGNLIGLSIDISMAVS